MFNLVTSSSLVSLPCLYQKRNYQGKSRLLEERETLVHTTMSIS